ncbi:MAG: hypothetical protein JO002_05835 [Burkholderiaceae bacterium]|nr:hypothetical protein [Burkholderiaceae bacterium]
MAQTHDYPTRGDFAAYEAAKHAWRTQHPDATHHEYTAAMRALADLHGV